MRNKFLAIAVRDNYRVSDKKACKRKDYSGIRYSP